MPRKDPIAHLLRHPRPTDRLFREVLALGPPALEQLATIATDRERWSGEALDVGNALQALARAEAPIGRTAALEVFHHAEPSGRAYFAAVMTLHVLTGPDDAGLFDLASLPVDRRRDAVAILADAGCPPAELVAHLPEVLAHHTAQGCHVANQLGADAIPALETAFDAALDDGEVDDACDLFMALAQLEANTDQRSTRLKVALAMSNFEMKNALHELYQR